MHYIQTLFQFQSYILKTIKLVTLKQYCFSNTNKPDFPNLT